MKEKEALLTGQKVTHAKVSFKKIVVPAGAAMTFVLAAQAQTVLADEVKTEEIKDNQESVETVAQDDTTVEEVTADPVIDETDVYEDPILSTQASAPTVLPGGQASNYTAPAPINSAVIDASKIEGATPTVTGDLQVRSNGTGVSTTKPLVAQGTTQIEGTATYYIEKAAVLPDGTTADIEIVIDNIFITASGTAGQNLTGEKTITSNAAKFVIGIYGADVIQTSWAMNVSFDYHVRVVDGSGKFLLHVYGMNKNRNTDDSYKGLYNMDPELVREKSSISGDGAEYVYIIDDYPNGYSIEGDSVVFAGLNGGGNADKWPTTGYSVGVDVSGTTVHFNGVGSVYKSGSSTATASNTMYAVLGERQHQHDYNSGRGGTIQTTVGTNMTNANENGKLNDDDILDPGIYAIPDGKSVTYTATPDKGYTLKTWTVDGSEVEPTLHMNPDGSKYWTYTVTGDEDRVIRVEWLAEYKITYDPNGGQRTMDEQDFLEDDTSMMSKDNEFTHDTRIFKGFYAYEKDPETGVETPIVDNEGNPVLFAGVTDMKPYFDGKLGGTEIRMEAQWYYTVTFVDEWTGRTIREKTDYPDGDPGPDPDTVTTTRDGYTFDGWVKDESDPKNIVYKAQWKRTFKCDDAVDDTIHMDKTLENDEPLPDKPTVTKPGYTFNGWTGGAIDDEGNYVYTAHWKRSVKYVDEMDESEVYKDKTEYFDKEPEPDAPENPTKKGYTFDKWTLKSEDEFGNKVYEANWTRTVIYDDAIDSSIYLEKTTLHNDEGEPTAPADPTKKGYTFTGWVRTEDDFGNIRYTAQWKRTVTYIDPETGEIYMPVTEFYNNDPEPVGPANPTREGYTFTGWTRSEDDFGNIVYEAHWEQIPPKPEPTPESEPTTEVKPAPIARHGGVQTDVQSSMGLWTGLVVGSQTILAGLFRKKKDEEE